MPQLIPDLTVLTAASRKRGRAEVESQHIDGTCDLRPTDPTVQIECFRGCQPQLKGKPVAFGECQRYQRVRQPAVVHAEAPFKVTIHPASEIIGPVQGVAPAAGDGSQRWA